MARLVHPDRLDHREIRDNLEEQGFLDLRELLARWVPPGLRGILVRRGLLVLLDHRAHQVILGHQALQASRGLWVRWVILVHPVHQVPVERSVQWVQPEQQDARDLQVVRVPLVELEAWVLQASEDPRGIQDPRGNRAFRDLQVILVHQVSLAFQVQLDRGDLLGQLGLLEELDFLVLLEL